MSYPETESVNIFNKLEELYNKNERLFIVEYLSRTTGKIWYYSNYRYHFIEQWYLKDEIKRLLCINGDLGRKFWRNIILPKHVVNFIFAEFPVAPPMDFLTQGLYSEILD